VAQVGTHRVLTGYSRNTVSVRQVFRDVVVWAYHTVSRRVLRHLVCAGNLGVLYSTHQVLTASLVPRRVPSASEAHPPALCAHCGCLVSLCTGIFRERSADACSDQRRRHEPAHAHADGAADVVGTDLRADARADVIADVSRRCPGLPSAPYRALRVCMRVLVWRTHVRVVHRTSWRWRAVGGGRVLVGYS
jgi:hypothetical protein